ncbi:PDZ-binding protein [Polychytrium aggregatum]|uniref:PDZ-binding protein n=1 Tax=Polychytrium aggregatum TaxID=110093 RepID=UPI0022FE051D|nr:PDZ-binding protein [Polychytrium aggregatum]KAI9204245.1 PDZ-binding protein [Polychytrium aggregatum]
MVCAKCERKLGTLAAPDTWKEGSSNAKVGSSGRKLNENKLLSGRSRQKFSPYEAKCRICKQNVHQRGSFYCQGCAYKNGICAMCGVQILDTKMYKQSSK